MANKNNPSKRKLVSIDDEKLIRQVDYLAQSLTCRKNNPLPIDLEIFQKNKGNTKGFNKILVSIKPRRSSIDTKHFAKQAYYCSKKVSSRIDSQPAFGDNIKIANDVKLSSIACDTNTNNSSNKISKSISSVILQVLSSTCTSVDDTQSTTNDFNQNYSHYACVQPNMNFISTDDNGRVSKLSPNKIDISTLIITNTPFEESKPTLTIISDLNKRINQMERKIAKHDIVFRALDSNSRSSSEDVTKNDVGSGPDDPRPCCSYIQQYSQVPEASAFQRCTHQTPSPPRKNTIEKKHSSEQYRQSFTTYDGITARGRRQCNSVPHKRNDIPKQAAERVHKIRHKLNTIRDYRLMDTVHYLAQGEFAPRDDGIKLTPSREAVLSDIIYEDVCRTHWPNARMGRRAGTHSERCTARRELQRLIDGLLRERVAHVERRKRRHHKVVKMNHRMNTCAPVGKTGDIIVASHKHTTVGEDVACSDIDAGYPSHNGKHREHHSHRHHKSHDLILTSDPRKHRHKHDDPSPGPSKATRSSSMREPTCCFQTKTELAADDNSPPPCVSRSKKHHSTKTKVVESDSVASTNKSKSPRLVVKRDANRRKTGKEEVNLEHFILLPTLVVRTPSNMKRQKKFNDLYHKILRVRGQNSHTSPREVEGNSKPHSSKMKNIGLNVNITLTDSEELLNK